MDYGLWSLTSFCIIDLPIRYQLYEVEICHSFAILGLKWLKITHSGLNCTLRKTTEKQGEKPGTPGQIRTADLLIRRQTNPLIEKSLNYKIIIRLQRFQIWLK